HSAAIIFGGPMTANDGDDFIRREIEWVGVPLRDNKPFLGVCLGAQICAKFLGGKVFRHPSGHAEVGYYPVRPTPAGLAVVETWSECVYQAPRGFRPALRRRASRRRRHFRSAGDPCRPRLRLAISSRSHARDDAPLDCARTRPPGNARSKTAAYASDRSRGVRFFGPGVAGHFSEGLARRVTLAFSLAIELLGEISDRLGIDLR